MAESFAAVIDVSSEESSALRMVLKLTDDSSARSTALQRTKARAARICALLSVFPVDI